MTNELARVKHLLDDLRENTSDSEFGYRMEAFFAHLLMQYGEEIECINTTGHPDIYSKSDINTIAYQIKTKKHGFGSRMFYLSNADYNGVSDPKFTFGYLAILDCALPPEWIIVNREELGRFVGKEVFLETIRCVRNRKFSNAITDIFIERAFNLGENLHDFTYRLMKQYAMDNDHNSMRFK